MTNFRVTGCALFFLALALVGGVCAPATAQPQIDEPKAARVKAAFVFNFLKFTRWPKHAFAAADSPIVIAVLGHDPLGPSLDDGVAGKQIDGRAVQVRRFAFPKDDGPSDEKKQARTERLARQLSRCHLVYVAWPHDDEAAAVLARIDPDTTLLVADRPALARRGAMLALGIDEGRVVIYANRGAVLASALKVSSKLLHLARSVTKE